MYDKKRLLATSWENEPFPHAIIDGLWDPELLISCRAEFPSPDDLRWITYNDPEEYGKKAGDARVWGQMTHRFFREVRDPRFSNMLTNLTRIERLVADDIGGGMHETGEGGRLEMHIDFNLHPSIPRLERRINMLVFLNDEWEQDWGGTVRLGKRGDENAMNLLPLFNRTVIFECGENSYHGHPDPIVGDHLRRSLACYYYAPVREETVQAHSTVWDRAH